MARQQRQQRQEPPPAQTAVVRFDPAEATRKIVAAVDHRRPQLAMLLGIEAESERGKAMLDRFVTVALHAATSSPDILRATPESIVESIRDAAMLGLEPVGATGDGAIVVYDEKRRVERPGQHGGTIVVEERVPTAHFQPMYRGLLKLARRSAKIAHIDAHVVYSGDAIELDLGSEPYVRHAPVLDGSKRGEPIGAYAVAETTNGRKYVDWMTVAEIEIVRKKSRAREAMAWTDFWSEMARKTVIRRLMKRLPLETMAEHALRIESEAEETALPPADGGSSSSARDRLRAPFIRGAIAAPVETDGTAEAAADLEPDVEAQTGDAAVLVDPSGAETSDGSEWCGSKSDPALGDVEECVLPAGHDGPHRSKEDTRWPNR